MSPPLLVRVATVRSRVDRVRENDGCGEKVQPAGAVALLLEGTVADFAEPVEKHGPGEGVPGLTLVQAGSDFAAQAGVLEPVQQEEGPFHSAQFPQGEGEPVLAGAGDEFAHHQGRGHGAGFDGRGKA